MRIALGSDHRGSDIVISLVGLLREAGHEPIVLGACSGEPCDYPDNAWLVGCAVRDGDADRGILACGSGIGMCIAANKVRGVRAALVQDVAGASASRRHNNANVLCLAGDRLSGDEVGPIVDAFLSTEFEGGRHARRVEKMAAIERGVDPAQAAAVER